MTSPISKDDKFNKDTIIKSKIGLNNAGESCYMASIIQILIHLEKFLDSLEKNYTKNKLYPAFYKFLKKLDVKKPKTYYNYNYNYIEIQDIANVYHSINHKFKGTEGNNPMTFFNEFISDLNKNILSLFEGKKEVKLIGNNENKNIIEKTEENFIFYLITLDNKYKNINSYFDKNLNKAKEFENEKDEKIIEQITKFPEILVINLELEIDDYKPENIICIQKDENNQDDFVAYDLKAINKYSDAHSIA
jgi:uncharacterized UBP type Zn finger protein